MSYHKYPAIGSGAALRERDGATRTAKVVSTNPKQIVITVEDEQGAVLNFRPYHWAGPGTQWTHVKRYPTKWLRDDSGIVVVEFKDPPPTGG
ncbi:hypothetical protein [Bradyrhizobium sp. CCBAU 45384]|uniref:hypothetical protein n=1 Tax=Bradyrhizobium sp. CCBAU 45384 TaxID=858428 RepID=UPI0023058E4E|nr:hypothetical protein [Bradyrhizobium sp. CCBAU 45384]MDA9411893.1 hypothetical protein [Bradyrhizobium sp. CCBAU 45384]